MTHVSAHAEHLRIDFPGWESIMTGRRGITIANSSVRSATVESGWSSEILGWRSGLVISGFRKVGTFVHPSGTRRLVSMRRGFPLLRLAVDRDRTGYDEIVLSTPDAARIAGSLPAAVRG